MKGSIVGLLLLCPAIAYSCSYGATQVVVVNQGTVTGTQTCNAGDTSGHCGLGLTSASEYNLVCSWTDGTNYFNSPGSGLSVVLAPGYSNYCYNYVPAVVTTWSSTLQTQTCNGGGYVNSGNPYTGTTYTADNVATLGTINSAFSSQDSADYAYSRCADVVCKQWFNAQTLVSQSTALSARQATNQTPCKFAQDLNTSAGLKACCVGSGYSFAMYPASTTAAYTTTDGVHVPSGTACNAVHGVSFIATANSGSTAVSGYVNFSV